jgi:16S rRNA processing protein RimM
MFEREGQASPDWPVRPLAVGRLGRPHGLHGELTARLFHPGSALWDSPKRLFVAAAWNDGVWSGVVGWLDMQQMAPSAKPPRIKFRDVLEREQAGKLARKVLWVDRSSLPSLGRDEAYLTDLIGLEVVDARGVALGRVESIAEAGMLEFLVVEGVDAGQQWIPISPGLLAEVDVLAGRLRLGIELGRDGRIAREEVE